MSKRRNGSAIVAVLLLLAIGVVLAASVLATADAASATSRGGASRTQTRALAWSGVQGVMAELAQQRDSILAGEPVEVTPEWDLFTLDDGTRALVRLVDLTPEDPGELAPENAKLDLNSATAEMLEQIPGVDPTIVERILSARSARRFSSVEQLLEVEGVTARLLYGPTDLPDGPSFGAAAPEHPDAAEPSKGLLRYLTVFSFDPNVQLGLSGDTDHAGSMRVNLNQPWSDRLRAAIADRLGDAAADIVGAIMQSGRTFTKDADLVRVLRDLGVEPSDWVETFDLFTTGDDAFLPGRVDVNLAAAEVLACLPGVTPEQAAQIVQVRQSLDSHTRRTPVWLVTEGVLTPDDFEAAIDFITTRSTQWRARIEVGFEAGEPGDGQSAASAPMTIDDLNAEWDRPVSEPRLGHRLVVEAVIDIGSTRPRVAYLRDVTLLEEVLAWPSPAPDTEAQESPEPEPPGPGEEPAPTEPDEDPWAFDEGFADLDLGIDAPPSPGEADDAEPGAETAGSPQEEAAPPAEGPVDRRIGRWSTRQGGNR